MSDLGGYINHWDDYGGPHFEIACTRLGSESCGRCGRLMVETIEPTGGFDRATGRPTAARYHSCPTWVEGWRTSRWARWWATPGMGHDSHDADNPLSGRSYR